MPKFVHIDIGADDPERAAQFYRDVFGWTVTKLDGPMPYWLISTGDDPSEIGGGIGQRTEAWQTVIPTIDVASIDEYEKKLVKAGGTVVTPKQLIPGVGQLLNFKDPDGNIFSILQPAEDNPYAG
jgi:uncharacterized protein